MLGQQQVSRFRAALRLPRPAAPGAPGAARWALAAAAALAAALLLLLLAAVAERLAYRDRVLPGVRLAGAEVAGLPFSAATQEVAAAASRLEREPVTATAGAARFTLRPRDAGVDADERATARAVRMAGRRGNPLAQLLGPLLRRADPVEVAWVVRADRPRLARAVAGWAQRVDRPAVDGTLTVRGTTVVPVQPRPGQELDRAGAVAALAAALARPGGARTVALPVRTRQPQVGAAAVERAASRARELLASPVTVTAGQQRLEVRPADLGAALRARPAAGELELQLDEGALRAALRAQLAAVERPPTDARFAVTGGQVRIIPSVTGERLDLAGVAAAILRGEREVRGNLQPVAPKRDTAWARSLRIHEQVSTFTTFYQPGQPRVRNIHRAADLLRGHVVEPGKRFSLNQALGPRTPERGFVRAPVIQNGEFSEDYGGGVSQLATTTFNAIFFGGYRIVSYQPHSYYISRYPMGREATVSLPAPDLVFENDSRAGVLIHTSYTDRSVTVTFYGSRDGRRVRAEGPRILQTIRPSSEVQEVEDPNLPAGTVRTEPAFTGYLVEVFRVIEEPGKPPRRERFLTRYQSAPPKVIRGTGPVRP